MDLRILLLLTLAGIAYAATEAGSGDGEKLVSAKPTAATDDDDDGSDNDIYIAAGSGDREDKLEGSGAEPEVGTKAMKCEATYCWCIYSNGTEVPNTRRYAKVAEDCGRYRTANSSSPVTVAPVTIVVASILPIRARETAQPDLKPEVTATGADDDLRIIYVQEQKPTSSEAPKTTVADLIRLNVVQGSEGLPGETAPTTRRQRPLLQGRGPTLPGRRPPVVTVKSTAMPSTISNKINIKNTDTPKANIDEAKEEKTNSISGADSLVNMQAVKQQNLSAPTGLYITNPGILAAVIGGGVVALLCAILLVMFIIYRMRKKDEGSYPLNDTKPLKNYAYAKAPSREFYA